MDDDPLRLVRLTELMERTGGSPDMVIGLIDGPVASNHPALPALRFRAVAASGDGMCSRNDSAACQHGTFVAGILGASRDSPAPAICPDCLFLIRPIFPESISRGDEVLSATPGDLAVAIVECVDAGARVINLSLGLARPSINGEQALEQALTYAMRRGVIVVAAAGNQNVLGSSAISRHPWVVPVAACDLRGRAMSDSSHSGSVGKRGLSAPGDRVISLGADGGSLTLGGTSVAAAFVTGAIALLWSEFPSATASQIKLAVTRATARRVALVPPVLDAARAYQNLLTTPARA